MRAIGTGVYTTTDGGINWGPANRGLAEKDIHALAVHPTDRLTGFAGTCADALYKTTDGGETWAASAQGLAASCVYALAIDPSAPDTIYVGTESEVFKSVDGGVKWVKMSEGLDPLLRVNALAINPSQPTIVYAGTEEPGAQTIDGVYKSTDGGATWLRMSEGIGEVYQDTSIYALAIDPSTPSTVSAAAACNDISEQCSESEIYKTMDGGATWAPVLENALSFRFSALAIDPSDPSTVFASHRGQGMFRTNDGGATWTGVNDGLTSLFAYALTVQPSSPFAVYAGTSDGVFMLKEEVAH